MDIKVLIKKWMDTKNTNKSCSGGENAAKASEGLMMKHRKTNKVFFTQSRSGPYGRFRWGNAPVWLSIYCWEKTECYEGKETVSENWTWWEDNQPSPFLTKQIFFFFLLVLTIWKTPTFPIFSPTFVHFLNCTEFLNSCHGSVMNQR